MNENFLLDCEKLQQICAFFGLNLAKFATKIGIKNQELYAISSLKQKEFSRATLTAIAKSCPELSPYWLITGEGSMLAGTAAHHNAVATDHGKATVNHTEGGSVLESQQATIRDQAETIKQLTLILAKQ